MGRMFVTSEMVQATRERIRQQREGIPVVLIEDERPGLTPATRQRMAQRGLQFPLPAGPLPVIMEDEIAHTDFFPICGDDEHCCCQYHERQQIIQETTPRKRRRRQILVDANYEMPVGMGAPLNGNRGFNLMK